MSEETKEQKVIKAIIRKSLKTRNELRVKYGQEPYDVDEFIKNDAMTRNFYESASGMLKRKNEEDE